MHRDADLSDVDENSPAFAVVPRSVRFEPIGQAKVSLGDDYVEVPILGKAGSCVFYDTATYHTRLDSLTGEQGRRTMHQVRLPFLFPHVLSYFADQQLVATSTVLVTRGLSRVKGSGRPRRAPAAAPDSIADQLGPYPGEALCLS